MLLNDERPTIKGDSQQSRDFTYIESAFDADLKACLASHEAEGQLTISLTEGVSILTIFIKHLSMPLVRISSLSTVPAARGISSIPMPIIPRLWNFWDKSQEYDFHRGLNEAIDWYKANL